MKRVKLEVEAIHKKYMESLYDFEFREKTFIEQGKVLGVSNQTISKWFHEISPSKWENIKNITIERVARESIEINDALTKRAKTGDPQAVKLWKQIIEGWTEKSGLEVSRARDKELDAMANDDLVKMLIKDWPQDKKLAILSGGSGVLPLSNDASNSVDPGDSVGALKPTNEALDRIAEQVRLNEQELRESTGGDIGEWGDEDRSHPKSSSIYERGKG